MSQHGEITTETLSIDYDQKLVNGISATFSTSKIIWTVQNGSRSEHHELNRLTGMYYWTDAQNSAGPVPTFNCVKTPPKF
jgi:hypothetical protein